MAVIKDLNIQLKWAINTHCHADHLTGTGELKKWVLPPLPSHDSTRVPARPSAGPAAPTLFPLPRPRRRIPGLRSAISAHSGARADVQLKEGDAVTFGAHSLKVLGTPGHTDGCVTYLYGSPGDDMMAAFTGDALLIRGCGRTDFQQGNAERLYEMIHSKLFTLPPTCLVYPAHDYKGWIASTIGEEKALNPRLTKTKEEFVQIMATLNLPKPKRIDDVLPGNLKCGIQD